jgi:hypothetical protein
VLSTYNLPRGHLSASQVAEWLKCGACYYYNRIHTPPIPRPVGIALPIGSAVHKGVEHLRAGKSVEEALELAGEHFDKQVSVAVDEETGTELIIDLGKDHQSLGDAKDQALALARFALPKIAAVDAERGLLAAEYDLLSLPEEVRRAAWPFDMHGRIDALYGDTETGIPTAMVDLKTSSKRAAPDNFASIQFAIYGYYFHLTGNPIRLGADVVTKKKVPDFDTYWLGQNGVVSDIEYAGIRRIVLDVAAGISRGNFPARPSFYCAYDHGLPSFSVAVQGFGDAA